MTVDAARDDPELSASTVSTRPVPLRSVRTLLIGLVLACLLPGLIGVSLLIYGMYESGRERIERDTVQTARAMVKVVDGQLEG
ncbi:MAG: hypothetical protein ABIV63_16870, partial [Caldimonas sp.]